MAARRAYESTRGIRLQPALVLAPVPDPVLRAEHPSASLAVEDGEVTDRDPKRARLETARAALFDEKLVSGLGFSEGIDGQRRDYGDSTMIA